jgi:ribosomal protein S13
LKVQKLSSDQIEVINSILDQVRIHPQYNQSIEDAVSTDLEISLNYHTHPGEDSYCVSIISDKIDLLALTENKQSFVELAHISGIGKSEEDCIPLMSYLGKKLKEVYLLKKLPDVYLNGSLYLQDN